jgi:hypothetical protein
MNRVPVVNDGEHHVVFGSRVIVFHKTEKQLRDAIGEMQKQPGVFVMAGGERPLTTIDAKVVQEQGVPKLFSDGGV